MRPALDPQAPGIALATGMADSLLLISHEGDDEAECVSARLRQRGVSVHRLDTAAMATSGGCMLALGTGGRSGQLRVAGGWLDLERVGAVWLRRPLPVRAPAGYAAAEAACAAAEWEGWLANLYSLLDCRWFPGPVDAVRRANRKLVQLARAAAVGFDVPASLVTNQPGALLAFLRTHDGGVVAKGMGEALHLHLPELSRFTEEVSRWELHGLDGLRGAPVLFQQLVPKALELRVTVVEGTVFAVGIASQDSVRHATDWRRCGSRRLRHVPQVLPEPVRRRCVTLVREAGLRYGAIDLILTPDERYVFLEINPGGRWAWLEKATGLPITDAICDALWPFPGPEPNVVTELAAARHCEQARAPVALRWPPAPESPHRSGALGDGQVSSAPSPVFAGGGARRLAALCARAVPVLDGLRGLDPRAAQERVAALAAGTATVDLLWHRVGPAREPHYELLLREEAGLTATLSVGDARSQLWLLQKARRWEDRHVLAVNHQVLAIDDVLAQLELLLVNESLAAWLVDQCLMAQEIRRRRIVPDDTAIEEQLERFRRERGLLRAADFHAWLEARQLDTGRLDSQLVFLAAREQLARSVIAEAQTEVAAAGTAGATPAMTSEGPAWQHPAFAAWLASERSRAQVRWFREPAAGGTNAAP
jgi:hypothetical protein